MYLNSSSPIGSNGTLRVNGPKSKALVSADTAFGGGAAPNIGTGLDMMGA